MRTLAKETGIPAPQMPALERDGPLSYHFPPTDSDAIPASKQWTVTTKMDEIVDPFQIFPALSGPDNHVLRQDRIY